VKSDLTSFSRTMRALDADGMSPTLLALVLVASLGGVWTTWLVTARIPVYQTSEAARLEMETIHPIAAPVVGRVVATFVTLGREVKQGDVLLEIEAERERLETAEERARLEMVAGEISALQREIAAEEQAINESRRASRAAVTEVSQRISAAEAAAKQASEYVKRVALLEQQGLISAADAEKARADADARIAEVRAARAGIDRLGADLSVADRGRRARLAALMRERAGLEGLHVATASTVTRREREAERRRIRAPVSGRLGEVNPIQVGSIIREGERIASIIPSGQMRAVAEFAAPALGRLNTGQRARLRLEGFPWTQYGHVDATVTSVATETRDQRVRVELAVRRAADSQIPLQHGMPGKVEVEVERVAPFALVLRSLGKTLSGQPVAASTALPSAEAAQR
jgi:multidrug resistance efflux pump